MISLQLYEKPLRLAENRISYLIKGGELIDKFLGKEYLDHSLSQMWIASTVMSVLGTGTEGLSRLVPEDGGFLLKELIDRDPEAFLGEQHVNKWGSSLGILVKLLNSEDRLLVQVHPDNEKAMKYFNSRFGKTEAWYVIDTKTGEPAYVYAGFQPWANREDFRRLIEIQNTENILASLHKFEIHKGDIIFIPGGLPHAMDKDSLVVEIQEPTDITLRAERIRPDGSVLPEEALHSGIGMDGLLDCFNFDTAGKEETRKQLFLSKLEIASGEGFKEYRLIGGRTAQFFSMNKITLEAGSTYAKRNEGFVVVLVLDGSGKMSSSLVADLPNNTEKSHKIKKRTGDGSLYGFSLNRGAEIFLPSGVRKYEYTADSNLEILECYPPR